MKATPPKWAVRFFKWYCNNHLAEAVLGDMIEIYERRVGTLGKRRADLLFIWNVITFLQPFAIRKKSTLIHTNHIAMFRSNIKIAWRAMLRQRMYAAIKVGGFALGLATCIVIAVFIRHELSYDKHYKDGARIYRLYNEFKAEKLEHWLSFPASAASIIKHDFPEVEKSARLIPYEWFDGGDNLIRRDDQTEDTFEAGFVYADQELLDILEIPMVYGQREHALDKPNTIVISRRIAEKYFPNEDPTGKIFILNEDKTKPFTIGGVMENFSPYSHLQYDFLLTLTNVEFWPGEQTSWCCWNYNVYVKLKPGTDPLAFEKKLVSVRDTHYVGYLEKEGNQEAADVKKNHTFKLQAITDIYLKSTDMGDMGSRGDMRYIWLFGSIAIFILLLACINFINLSTAKSANRAKEVGLRKAVGSIRSYLVRQFLTESMLYSFISFLIAIALVAITLPWFNALAGKTISVPWTEWWTIPSLVMSAIVVGVIAGIYPSFYLSSFKPIDVLKGSVRLGAKSSALRSSMVVFQFTTSIILIIGTFVINRQMNYILNTKVGFDKDQVVMIQGANTLDKQLRPFKNELLQLSQVKNVTITDYLPVGGTKRDQNGFWLEGKQKEDKSVGAQRWNVDEDYLKTMGMKLVEGRNFNHEIASDSQAVIINQSMARALGLKKPLGARIANWQTFTVIGVVEDFHFESMKGKIGPLCMTMGWWGSIVSVKVGGDDMKGNLAAITGVWNKFMPNQPFRYTFLDDSYSRMYDDVRRMGNIFATFAALAIIVACLGLFALSAFMAEQRTKEISIRLVLGASVNSIFRLLTQNFMKLVIISFVIATPAAWFMMNEWLADYAYRIDLTWDVFIISGVISVMVALLTVSYQSLRAAFVNPATSLRSE
jgi:putative ABC transport system permease protein